MIFFLLLDFVDLLCNLLEESKSPQCSFIYASVIQKLMENIHDVAMVDTVKLIQFFTNIFTKKR